MSSIYSFLLHFFAVVVSAFQVSPATTVRVASHAVPGHAHVVEAAVRAPDSGYWHTSGNLILDQQNRTVRIQGINWYGLETVRQVPGGLTQQDYRAILRTIRENGFNTVRIPFSSQMVESPVVPEAISFENDHGPINMDLRGLTSLEILDRIVEEAGKLGLKVILDNHRSEAGDSAEASGLWYTAEYPEQAWIADWQRLARRYLGNSTVIGVDLRNEPHNANSGGACWGCGGERDWRLAAERGGDAVLRVNPRLIVFVEGVDAYNNDFYWWGGNLEGVRRAPVRLAVPRQLVYSAHSYGPNEYQQKWFNAETTPASLENVWDRHWAYVSREGIAPVWLGEFGTTNRTEDISGSAPGSEGQWFGALVAFLGRNPELSWSSWALNGEDANGLLSSDYSLVAANPLKMQLLAGLESPALSPRPLTPAVLRVQSQTQVAYQPAYAAPQPAYAAPQPAYGERVGGGVVRQAAYEAPAHGVANAGSPAACHVSYRNVADTGYGATGVIEIENLSGRPIAGWTLLWEYGGTQQVEEARNARFLQSGDTVEMTNTGANEVIPAGGSVAGIVVQTSYRGANRQPVKFYLNGGLCG
ncbi:cellulase family glycosylhydrolase [Edaphobacter bradus]|uniref:cellulase family glycosylhydrolase n=1 Tax=Edaphobacter bradus TaxID=2259016 RepID=UPI0021DF9295|nr:cellulase family glycosylhydrolase [Edaphobacter bradus]